MPSRMNLMLSLAMHCWCLSGQPHRWQLSAQVFVGAVVILFGLFLYFYKDLGLYRRLKI